MPQFLKVGQWMFAVQHIAAININNTAANFDPAVSLHMLGDNEPWIFRHGTPEAEALIAFVKAHEPSAPTALQGQQGFETALKAFTEAVSTLDTTKFQAK